MSTSNASKKESKWHKYTTKVEWCVYVNNVNAFVFVDIFSLEIL